MLGGNLGGGVVIAKVPDASEEVGYRWSAPVAVQCGGLGGGFIFGGEQIDSIIILNTKSAIRAFTGRGQVTFGGNVALAVGPVGREIEAHIGASDNKELLAAYSYSQAKGAFIGGTLEGAIMFIRDEENKKFYDNPNANAEALLSGAIKAPFKAQALATELAMVVQRKGSYAKLEQTRSMKSSGNLADSGRALVRDGLRGGEAEDLPDGWETAMSPEGKVYYYNIETQATQWEKPMPVAAFVPPPPPPAPVAPPVVARRPQIPVRPSVPTAVALYDYKAAQPDELTIAVGDKIEIVEKVDANWWKGRLRGRTGMVPATYLKE